MIEVEGLTKYYGSHAAIRELSFRIERGEVIGFLGLNGAGKSTTLRILGCVLLPTAGRVTIDGFDVMRDPHEIRKRIGFLPDTPPVYGEMTVRRYLAFVAELRGVGRAAVAGRIQEVSAQTGIADVLDQQIATLSHGYRQRVGLAQAIVHNPALLILDEPTSGLDPLGTRQVKDLILELGRRGKTILLTSHLLADVEDVCSRMVILYGGKIRAQGTGAELLADSRHTLLRMPRLDERTIAAVDETLHRVQGVGIEQVSAPRQSLEELFLDIVEKAKAEQIETSGAQSGGRIASFLASEEADASGRQGRSVVDELVAARPEPAKSAPAKPQAEAPGKQEVQSVLDELTAKSPAGAPAQQPAPVRKAESKSGDAAVDQSLIDSLLSSPKDGKKDGGSAR